MLPEDLILRLSSSEPDVRLRAARELGLLDDPDALACLVESLVDAEPAVRQAAYQALCKRTGLDLGPERESWLQWWKEKASIRCVRCNRRLFASRLYYLVKLQMTSEPREIYLTEADLRPRSSEELRRAAEALSDCDADEAQDEVYVRLRYYLCTPCKLQFVQDARANGAVDEE